MKWHVSGQVKKDQNGFTLLELLLAIAIAGIIGTGIVASIFQTYTGNAISTAHMTAVKEVETAVHWITPDAEMAQEEFVDPLDDSIAIIGVDEDDNISDSDGLRLAWSNPWARTRDEVIYVIQEDGKLTRTYTHTDKDGNQNTTVSVVAKNINSADSSSEFSDGVLIFTITASTGSLRPASETRTFQVNLRSESRGN